MRKRWSLWLAAVLGFVVGGAASIYGVAIGQSKPATLGTRDRGFVPMRAQLDKTARSRSSHDPDVRARRANRANRRDHEGARPYPS